MTITDPFASRPCLFRLSFIESARDDSPAYLCGSAVEPDGRIVMISDALPAGMTTGRGVELFGDIRHMVDVADRWHLEFNGRRPWPAPLHPFLDAHIAFAILRNQKRADIDALTRWVLADAKRPIPNEDEAHERLAGWLTVAAGNLLARLGQVPDTLAHATTLTDGIPFADAQLASQLTELGKGASKAVASVHKAGAQHAQLPASPWDGWVVDEHDPKPATWALRVLALTGWECVVRPTLVRERQRPKAIVRPVYASQVMLMHAGSRLVEDASGQHLLPGMHEGGSSVRIAHADARLFARIKAGIDKLGTLTAHRLVRWEITTGYQQFLERERDPEADARIIKITGGYSALAREHLGLKSNADVEAVRDIITAQDACVFDFPWANEGAGHNGRLLTREEIPAARGRQAQVRLVLGTMLLPHFADLTKHQEGQRGQFVKLVPMTDLPPLVGSPNQHGAQVSLSMMLVLWLRDHARILHEQGGVKLRQADLQRMASEVGLTDGSLLGKLWDRWHHDGDDAPAFVKAVEDDRYTLADAHAAARQSILDAGRGEADGSKWGRASAAGRATAPGGGPRPQRAQKTRELYRFLEPPVHNCGGFIVS